LVRLHLLLDLYVFPNIMKQFLNDTVLKLASPESIQQANSIILSS
jgi:hypothetical protein